MAKLLRERKTSSIAWDDLRMMCNLVDWPARASDNQGWIALLIPFKEERLATGDPDCHKDPAMDVSRCAGIFTEGDKLKWDKTPGGRSSAKLTIGTLRYWAKHDSPEAYAAWKISVRRNCKVEAHWNNQDVGRSRIAEAQLTGVIKLTGQKQNEYLVFDREASVWRDASVAEVKGRVNEVLDREQRQLRDSFSAKHADAETRDDKETAKQEEQTQRWGQQAPSICQQEHRPVCGGLALQRDIHS